MMQPIPANEREVEKQYLQHQIDFLSIKVLLGCKDQKEVNESLITLNALCERFIKL